MVFKNERLKEKILLDRKKGLCKEGFVLKIISKWKKKGYGQAPSGGTE
jgi:hypothetical protein